MLLHREGAEVNKNDPNLLHALESLYAIIKEYEPENVYNMVETGLFFRLLLRFSLLMPDEDFSTTRGKKNERSSFSDHLHKCNRNSQNSLHLAWKTKGASLY